MHNLLKIMLALILLAWLLAPGCATPDQAPTYRSYESRSWWGDDPTCSPGCPPSLPGGY